MTDLKIDDVSYDTPISTSPHKRDESKLSTKLEIMAYVGLIWYIVIHLFPAILLKKELSWSEGIVNAFATVVFFAIIRWFVLPV